MTPPSGYNIAMQSEIEATFVDVEHEQVRKRLEAAGGRCVSLRFRQRRVVYDYPDLSLDKKAAWVRVRQEVDRATLSFKQRQNESIEGMKEIETEIADFDSTCRLLEAIGLTVKAEQETDREVWEIDGCEVMLDEWPWIPPFIEIEGPDEASVQALAKKLGFSWEAAVFDSTDGVYQRYYDVARTKISTVPIKFGPIPDWLEEKRKA
jgi:adenylate cyclase, class 2